MSLEQAKLKIGQGFQSSSVQGTDPAITYFVSWNLNEGWAIETVNDRVAYVEHIQRWTNPDTMPLQTDVRAKLQAKYGGKLGQMDWTFDTAGHLSAPDVITRCSTAGAGGQVSAYFPQVQAFHSAGYSASRLAFPTKFLANCPVYGVDLSFTVNTQRSDVAIGELRISLEDEGALYKETAERNAVVLAQKNAEDQKRNAERQKPKF